MRYQLRERLITIGENFKVQDDQGHDVYVIDQQLLRIRDEFQFKDLQGREVALIKRKLLALRPVYEIWRDGQQVAVVRRAFIRFLRDKYEVDVPGPDDLEITGNILNHEYSFTRGGKEVAHVSKRWVSLTDAYGVDVAEGQDDVLILASAVVIDRVSHDLEEHKHFD